MEFLVEQLKQGKSETLTAYLGAMARFHSYRFSNIQLYAGNASLLAESLEVIQRTSTVVAIRVEAAAA